MKNSYIIAFALILLGTGVLVYTGISSDAAYFVDVAEAKSIPADKLHGARVFGTVSRPTIAAAPKTGASFTLSDRNSPSVTMPVRYTGALPNAFKEGAEVIVEGDWVSTHFEAKTLITKCPSKYQKANRK